MSHNHTTPSKALLKAVRADFIVKGTSLNAWCVDNGLRRQNVAKALTGDWRGPKATEVVELVVCAARLGLEK